MKIEPAQYRPAQRHSSARVPRELSDPRSMASSVNRLMNAAEGLGLAENPLPDATQDTVSALGAGFAAFNVGAKLYSKDWLGSLESTAGSSVSLVGGVKLLTEQESLSDSASLIGAALNGGLAIRDVRTKKYLDASLKAATAIGLSMTALGVGEAASVGLAVLGVSGLCDFTRGQLKKDASKEAAQELAAREGFVIPLW